MEVITDQKSLALALKPFREAKQAIGLVPTMGALHAGHLSLVARAMAENKVVVVSIFVNPTQFNSQEDLDNYPESLLADCALLETMGQQVIVFAPGKKEMYPEGLTPKNFNFNGLDLLWEGADRPGHFNGVGTVVEKLFTAVPANRAYFGEKDFQQLAAIRQLVALHQWPIEIIGCAIVREPHGLAMSSRNERLSPENRKAAAVIFKALTEAAKNFKNTSLNELKNEAITALEKTPGLSVFYFEAVQASTLLPINNTKSHENARLICAVSLQGVRLIDNMAL